ncbi:MAG TPA: phosphotransferase family protein [Candidatus Margulisiibacteriota bacterium]|nr:phosphotransferase family protein [Candidatus Margulisiibacteriota bacterium]
MADLNLAPASDAPETIPIREGEDFDHARLAEYLKGKLPHSERALEVVQFAGGHANLTYLLRYGDAEYVLRRPPLGPVAPSSHDMGREYRVLSVLYQGYRCAPRAYLFCEDPAIIGAPFFIMERRRGIVVRRAVPPQWGGGTDPVVNRKISEVLIDTLADLHDVDPRAVGLETLGKPDGFMRRQIDGWTGRYERAKTKDVPIVGEMAQWLRDHLPPSPTPTLLHNDWRLDNMMLDANDPGRCEAVFDWDMCTIGDPFADLGTLLSAWIEESEGNPGQGQVGMPSNTPGFLTRREAVQRYGQRRGIDISNVPYYYVFGIYKIAVVLQQIYHRYHLGQTKDQRFQFFEQGAEMLFWKAKESSEKLAV